MASKVLSKLAHYRDRLEQAVACIVDLRELILEHETQELRRFHANPLNRFGLKCFSQADEDGITLEILRRIGCVSNGTFAEFGVGNGLENNTLILKAIGWRGFWAGGENLAFDIGQPSSAFSYFKEWITLENIESIAIEGKKNLQCQEMDVISLDLDGNDYYFARRRMCTPRSEPSCRLVMRSTSIRGHEPRAAGRGTHETGLRSPSSPSIPSATQ